jgi:alkylated DNA repair dioxygenase AlkB
MATFNKGVINDLITLIFLDLEDHPFLKDYRSLSELIRADNNCSRNYYNHVATWYGDVDYGYTGVTHKAKEWPFEFEALARDLEEQLEYPEGYFNCLLANLYSDTGIAPHSDDEPIFRNSDGTVGAVATISLGDTAIATIARKDRSKEPFEIKLREGSCYLMPEGNFQNEYKHSVSKPQKDNRFYASPSRISLTFRHIP